MPSARYRVIVAMLDDPLNRVAITRELLRRGTLRMMPPPVPVKNDNVKFGWLFPTLRHAMSHGLPAAYAIREVDSIDAEVHVFTDGDHWFVNLLTEGEGGLEVGPFDTSALALAEARKWLEDEGYLLLNEVPWEQDDVETFALKI